MMSPVVIILAAGRGERFRAAGGKTHKLDALLGGQPVLWHTVQAVNASGLAWHLMRPENGTPGMGDSIALGVNASREAAGWLILPGDLPLITPASLQRVAAALTDSAVVVPQYGQQQGHPVAFGRDYRDALTALSGDTGARGIVHAARQRAAVCDLPLMDAGIVCDIDTPDDLYRAQRQLGLRA